MTALTHDKIEKMDKKELATACKAKGIKHGKLSLMQQRTALKALVVEIPVEAPVHVEEPGIDLVPVPSETTDAPASETTTEPAATTTETAPVVEVKKAEGPRPGSKMEKAVALFTENKGKPRKEIIKLFQSEAGLTAAGSNTYYALIKKNQK
jgi:hypothetical protein